MFTKAMKYILRSLGIFGLLAGLLLGFVGTAAAQDEPATAPSTPETVFSDEGIQLIYIDEPWLQLGAERAQFGTSVDLTPYQGLDCVISLQGDNVHPSIREDSGLGVVIGNQTFTVFGIEGENPTPAQFHLTINGPVATFYRLLGADGGWSATGSVRLQCKRPPVTTTTAAPTTTTAAPTTTVAPTTTAPTTTAAPTTTTTMVTTTTTTPELPCVPAGETPTEPGQAPCLALTGPREVATAITAVAFLLGLGYICLELSRHKAA